MVDTRVTVLIMMANLVFFMFFGLSLVALLLALLLSTTSSTLCAQTAQHKILRFSHRFQEEDVIPFSTKRSQGCKNEGGASSRMDASQRLSSSRSLDRGIETRLSESYPRREDEELAKVFARRLQGAIASRGLHVAVEGFATSRRVCGDDDSRHAVELVVNVVCDDEAQLLESFYSDDHDFFGEQDDLAIEPTCVKKACGRSLGQHLISIGVVNSCTEEFDGERHYVRLCNDYLTAALYVNNSIPTRMTALLADVECKYPDGAKLAFCSRMGAGARNLI
eukprot:TRINITY_DN24173_c0_g1_i2.p1 TRINITY_DN24173_c0_g1~~TRINITY_DN24173_c0_g1_i2.p1  ORF type:complete len:293 (+),score=43.54 TRINITY_DN24173_c0_g1_i2:43-879(+)